MLFTGTAQHGFLTYFYARVSTRALARSCSQGVSEEELAVLFRDYSPTVRVLLVSRSPAASAIPVVLNTHQNATLEQQPQQQQQQQQHETRTVSDETEEECSFATKVYNAQSAGASAVVIHDYAKDAAELVHMGLPHATHNTHPHNAFLVDDDDFAVHTTNDDGSSGSVVIPSVFVAGGSGDQLMRYIKESPFVVGLPVHIQRQDMTGFDLTLIALLSAFGLTLALCSTVVICAGVVTRVQWLYLCACLYGIM